MIIKEVKKQRKKKKWQEILKKDLKETELYFIILFYISNYLVGILFLAFALYIKKLKNN